MTTFCPKHFTLEDVDCEEPIVACPPRIPLDPTKHLIVTCGPCDRTRVVPVDRVMKGTVQATGQCQLSECAATVMLPEVPPLVTTEELATLRKDSDTLARLEAAGVDNWEGYSEAFRDEEDEETDPEPLPVTPAKAASKRKPTTE